MSTATSEPSPYLPLSSRRLTPVWDDTPDTRQDSDLGRGSESSRAPGARARKDPSFHNLEDGET